MSTQTDLLKILEENRGEPVSGEALAEKLSLSRSAVWKAIKGLRDKGYQITSKTRQGYTLCKSNDILSAASIAPWLKDPAQADRLEVYPSLDSTNSFGKERALAGAPDGTVIIAESQTGGRGRMGRTFFSPGGSGIYLSIILRPGTAISQSLFITIAASVLIRQAIADVTGLEPEIKWVNDLYIKDKKICGILTEAAADFETGNIDYIVLGAGINFTEPKQGFPEELNSVAGALFKEAPDGQLRSRLAAELVNRLSRLTRIPEAGAVMADYRKHSMVIGKPVTILNGREPLEGVVSDINDAGHLILKKDDGTFQSIVSGEVSLRLR